MRHNLHGDDPAYDIGLISCGLRGNSVRISTHGVGKDDCPKQEGTSQIQKIYRSASPVGLISVAVIQVYEKPA